LEALLTAGSLTPGAFIELCNINNVLWGKYPLNSEKGAPPKGWLFWEASQDITGTHDAVFAAQYLNRLVEHFTIVEKAFERLKNR
jgi:hypothetical protein